MPSTGTPASYTAGSIDGAPSTWTDAGPPERMIAFGRRGEHLRDRHVARHDLAVDVRLTHAAGDQLRVLRTEVDDENEVVVGASLTASRAAQRPMPTPCDRWSDLPSVRKAGATITSAFWNSLTVS